METLATNQKFSQLIAKCWADEAYKKQMLADPAGTLKAAGLAVPPGITVKVIEGSADVMYVVIPPKPTDLADEVLDEVVAGGRAPNSAFTCQRGTCTEGYIE